jgi:cytochrome c oxidase assembly factor CtaG
MAEAILTSWRFDPRLICLLAAAAWLYVRGWLQLHRQSPRRYSPERLAAYLSGLTALFVALASPLDAFGNLLLEAHMVQHMLLLVVAPPLILLGQPVVPILRGLPARVLKDGLGPFLSWRGLRRVGRRLTHPMVCWLAMAWAIVFWHMPRWYELGLSSPAWHGIEHACFFYAALLFWWPVIQVWPSHAQWPRWMMIPYLVVADIVNTALSAWLVFSSHVVYRTYELAPRLSGMTALDDQSTAGAIMWVPGSIAYLIPAFFLTMQALNGVRSRPQAVRIKPVLRQPVRQPFDLLRVPVLRSILRYRYFRRVLQAALLALAVAMVIDGLFGPQIAPLNLAGVLPWTYWRGFAVVALLVGGNFFCMACPFMLPRELGRRFLPAQHRWPRMLRSKWLAAALLVLYLWAYEVFSLWSSPWWTAWIIVGYFTTAFVVDGFFRGASFCKYVCPIGQFHFVNALVSPLEVKVRSQAVCASCHTHDCIRGNQTQRGCELQLFQPRKTGNFDCTFCLDCVQACPQDNVGILSSIPGSALLQDRHSSGIGRLSKRSDVAPLAWILVFGAVINAAAMVDPVIGWMHSLQASLGLRSMLPVTTGLYIAGILVAPALLTWLCGSAAAIFGRTHGSWKSLARSFGLALIPLGFSMWVAHFLFHLLAGWRSVVPVFERIMRVSTPAVNLSAAMPSWLPAAQILLLDGGLILSLYIAWRTARRETGAMRRALGLVTPWAVLAIGIYAASIWILFQPMQMRGMVM